MMYTWFSVNIMFMKRKFVTIYVHSTLLKFCKNVKFGLVALAFHYGSCFNVSLSRHTLEIYFAFKKLILKKIAGPNQF